MKLIPINSPSDPSSDIFSGDKWLGLITGIGTFLLMFQHVRKPSSQSLTMLVYWMAIPTIFVFLIFFIKLYAKNAGRVPRIKLLVPFIAVVATILVCFFFVWPIILSIVDFQVLFPSPFLGALLLLLPLAGLVLIWQVVQIFIPGKWWKNFY
ncbi:MAG: hypothetical protein IKZ87_08025 [Actinomycetaceae bacterium]|nr:hypothetical protein [Actinomycetaceae bacterium]